MLRITPSSPVPIYEQLVSGISTLIEDKKLKPGESLPPIRTLAKQLDVASNTVARAYMELERKGLIISNGRKGSFVNPECAAGGNKQDKRFKDLILDLVREGYGRHEIIRVFNSNLSDIFD